MKRIISILVTALFCIVAFCPIINAKTYDMEETDMKVQIDDSVWYVFTRDNIKDNPELEELEVSYDYIHNLLYDNKAYLYAILFYEDGGFLELFVRKTPTDAGVANLTNYDEKDVSDFAKALAKKQNAKEYSAYKNKYNFARLEYIDPTLDYHICEYVTVVNKNTYALTFQSASELGDFEYDEIENIVDSIEFNIDTSLKEEMGSSFDWGNVAIKTLIGAACGAAVGGVIALITKLKKRSPDRTDNRDFS